ncbi:MAG TPA: MBL fold metallo-hydrolase [Candidatus Bathyarchaeia archaeon]|nr:MBL fold metallo-hydrolase [Candidatus Bathyarchaeia archaeon]
MNKVKVLIEGYAREIKDGFVASSTTVLIKSNGKRIVVDPGINRKLLLAKLRKEGLKLEDIDFVYMTHYHL